MKRWFWALEYQRNAVVSQLFLGFFCVAFFNDGTHFADGSRLSWSWNRD